MCCVLINVLGEPESPYLPMRGAGSLQDRVNIVIWWEVGAAGAGAPDRFADREALATLIDTGHGWAGILGFFCRRVNCEADTPLAGPRRTARIKR